MNAQEQIDFNRIATAIEFIGQHFKTQPDLDAVAAKVHLSPFHFQRMFTAWAGVSPKKFLQYLTVEHTKKLLQQHRVSLVDAAYDAGLSGTGRLHDLFVSIEGMTPGEYKNGGASLSINYSYAESPFGHVLVASTEKGICHMAFADAHNEALQNLRAAFPQARLQPLLDAHQQNALYIFAQDWSRLEAVKLHLKATPFQLKVWQALLAVPMGSLCSYQKLATQAGHPQAVRAVGTAVGQNPVAFLIPCHRVIQSTGLLGQYHWGPARKAAIVGWESARAHA